MTNDSTKITFQGLKTKAFRKKISKDLAITLATRSKDPTMAKAYWNSYYCNNTIMVEDGVLRSSYCKNRWCLVCQSIKMANVANGYGPQIEKMVDPYFVTLTARTVVDWALADNIKMFYKSWRSILRQAVKEKRALSGLKKTECTVRPGGLYHFHYHVIIEGQENAEWLVTQWLNTMPNTEAPAQDVRPLDRSKPVIEIFKYFTKLTTKVEGKEGRRFVDPARLDVIFKEFKGLRVFQPFGSLRRVNEDRPVRECGVADGLYNWHHIDWFDFEGVRISDCVLDPEQNTTSTNDNTTQYYNGNQDKRTTNFEGLDAYDSRPETSQIRNNGDDFESIGRRDFAPDMER